MENIDCADRELNIGTINKKFNILIIYINIIY